LSTKNKFVTQLINMPVGVMMANRWFCGAYFLFPVNWRWGRFYIFAEAYSVIIGDEILSCCYSLQVSKRQPQLISCILFRRQSCDSLSL